MIYESFIEHRFDYVFFVYGLSFLVLAHVSLLIAKASTGGPPWKRLAMFGALHGVLELMELLTQTVGDNEPFATLRAVILAASYVFLFEFGRGALVGRDGRDRGVYVLPILLLLSATGAWWGLEGADVTIRWSLGLPSGLCAATVLYRESGNRSGAGWLLPAAAGMGLYGLLTGLVTAAPPGFPLASLSNDMLMGWTGVPVQLFRTAAMFIATASLFMFCTVRAGARSCPTIAYGVVLLIVAAGFPVTEAAGVHVENEARKTLMSRTLTAAATIQREFVSKLTGSPADDGRPEFEQLRMTLRRLKEVNQDTRFIYLMGLRDGKEFFMVDAEEKGSKDYSRPGDPYPDATPEEIEDFRRGVPKFYKPYKDSWGFWVSGVSFINAPGPYGRKALFGMDINANAWKHSVALVRLFCMAITLTLAMLWIALITVWRRDRDSAERDASLRQRVEDEERLRQITDSLGEGVIVRDAGRVIRFANPEAERLLGWERGTMTGRPSDDVFGHMAVQTTHIEHPGKGCCAEECVFIRKDGAEVPVSMVSTPLVEGERVSGSVTAFRDITALKDVELQKADFYAMVTHDLKSPLAVIQGYTSLLESQSGGSNEAESMEMLRRIRENCDRTLRLVEDFLTVSRLDSGKKALNLTLVDLHFFFREATVGFIPAASDKGVTLLLDPPEKSSRALFDWPQMQRAVSNLIENAIKFTPAGGEVAVSAGLLVDDKGVERAVFTVSDTGPGIPPKERDQVFERYYRSSRTSGLKGTGLGLVIVKAVASAHGGSIELESEEGKGSTFRLLIPADRA